MSTEQFNELVDRFGVNYINNIEFARDNADVFHSLFNTDEIGFHIFPDDFGGIYINEDGILVIQERVSFARSEPWSNELSGVLYLNFVEFRQVEFSRRQLEEVQDYISDFMIRSTEAGVPLAFNMVGLDERNNRVLVSLRDYNEKQVELFKQQVIDSPMVIFEQSVGEIVFAVLRNTDIPRILEEGDEEAVESMMQMLEPTPRNVTVTPGMPIRSATHGMSTAGYRVCHLNTGAIVGLSLRRIVLHATKVLPKIGLCFVTYAKQKRSLRSFSGQTLLTLC